MADFSAHNLKVLRNLFKDKKSGISAAEDKVAIEILERTAASIYDWVQSESYTYENQTWNLTDSIGFAIYKSGVMIKMVTPLPPQRATGPSEYTYKRVKYTEYGRAHLKTALYDMKIASMGDYVLGVFVAAPYGEWVDKSLGAGGSNKRGKGWFSGPNGLSIFAVNEFNRIKYELINNKQYSK